MTRRGRGRGHDQARDPAGSGRWVLDPVSHPESDQHLAAPQMLDGDLVISPIHEIENARGTWDVPAAPHTAAQHLRFWLEVPIPADVIHSFVNAYSRVNGSSSDRQIRAGKRPPRAVHPGLAHHLIRAMRIAEEARLWLPEHERDRALSFPLPYPGDNGHRRPAPEIIERFRLWMLDSDWENGYSGRRLA